MRAVAFLFLQFLIISMGFAQQKPKLYVFMPTNVRPINMEKSIAQICDQLQVTVFGRHRDLRRTVEAAPPDAILAPSPVINSDTYSGYQSKVRGSRDNETDEAYVLVSVEKPVVMENLGNMSIGAVDLLGRRAMMDFISERLGGARPGNFELVTKQEELLTILQFQDADAIFVPESLVTSYFRKRSKMKLVTTPLPDKIALPMLSMRQGQEQAFGEIVNCLNGMTGSINNKFGVDKWIVP